MLAKASMPRMRPAETVAYPPSASHGPATDRYLMSRTGPPSIRTRNST